MYSIYYPGFIVGGRYLIRINVFILTLCTILLCGIFIPIVSAIDPPEIEWQQTFGGNLFDEAFSVASTNDGGCILAGYTTSDIGNISGYFGNSNVWVIKLTKSGVTEWQRVYGGSGDEVANSITTTSDGGYILTGYATSFDGDVSGQHGGKDIWVVKLNSTGIIEWQQTYGGSKSDDGYCISTTPDGGYILIGDTVSSDGDVTDPHGHFDVWVLKLKSNGDIDWQQNYGGSNADSGRAIATTSDGGFIFAGNTESSDGDVSESPGFVDFWVVKLDGTGAIEWQQVVGRSGEDMVSSLATTADGGCVVIGRSFYSQSHFDVLVVKLSDTGDIEWMQFFGGSGSDLGYDIIPTYGGYILVGSTSSSDGDVTECRGADDFWVFKFDDNRYIKWQRTLGGSESDRGYSIATASDGGHFITGSTCSDDGDVTINNGESDVWVGKLISQPIVDFSAQILSGFPPLTTKFYDLSKNNPISWEWDFGDGSAIATEHEPTHTYTHPGGYTVTLVTTNEFGEYSEIKNNYITVYPPPPISYVLDVEEGEKFRGESANATIEITNEDAITHSLNIEYALRDAENKFHIIYNETRELPGDGQIILTDDLNWTIPADIEAGNFSGRLILTYLDDPGMPELITWDTNAFELVVPGKPDLDIESIRFLDDEQDEVNVVQTEQHLQANIELINKGGTPVDLVNVSLFLENNGENVLLNTRQIDSLTSGISKSFSIEFNAPGGSGVYPVTVVVDPENLIEEENEENNNIYGQIKVITYNNLDIRMTYPENGQQIRYLLINGLKAGDGVTFPIIVKLYDKENGQVIDYIDNLVISGYIDALALKSWGLDPRINTNIPVEYQKNGSEYVYYFNTYVYKSVYGQQYDVNPNALNEPLDLSFVWGEYWIHGSNIRYPKNEMNSEDLKYCIISDSEQQKGYFTIGVTTLFQFDQIEYPIYFALFEQWAVQCLSQVVFAGNNPVEAFTFVMNACEAISRADYEDLAWTILDLLLNGLIGAIECAQNVYNFLINELPNYGIQVFDAAKNIKIGILFSPATIHIYDSTGNHVGVNETGLLEDQIEGIAYSGPDTHPQVVVIVGDNLNYTIYLKGEDYGFVDFELFDLAPNDTPILWYTQIEVTPDTNARIPLAASNPDYLMFIDYDGDGVNDEIIAPDINGFYTMAEVNGQEGINGWYISDVEINLTAVNLACSSCIPSVYYSYDNLSWELYTQPLILSDEGENLVYYYSANSSENTEKIRNIEIDLDKTPPEIFMNLPPDGAIYNVNQNEVVNYSVNDAVSGISSINSTYLNGSQLETATAGNFVFTVNATDKAGNTAYSQVYYTINDSQEDPDSTIFTTVLDEGWNTFSTPIALESGKSTFEEIFSLTDQQKIEVVLGWDGTQWFIPDASTEIESLYAYFIKVEENSTVTATLVPLQSVSTLPSRQLIEGVNLIGPAPEYDIDASEFHPMLLKQALISIEYVENQMGYLIVVSPNVNQLGWAYVKGSQERDLLPFKGYWVVMENGPDTMYGFSTTPI